jgi:opacity protein-like surface antigen
MRYPQVVAVAGVTALSATASMAADLAPVMPPPPPPIVEFSGWYLRGDIGMTNQQVDRITNVLDSTAKSINTVQKGFDSGMLFGIGLGYQWNNWLRTDLTGEYRSKTDFHGLQVVNSGGRFTDEYRASKSEWLWLANAYVDLGTWWNVTPFIGAGVGMSYNRISDFIDINTPRAGVAFGGNHAKWNFAWAVHAGLAYRITDSVTMELAYRYLDLGDAESGDLVTYLGQNRVFNPEKFHDITSHDIKLGIRWAFGAGAGLAPAYAPTYAPAPTYLPPEPNYAPPLERRG